MKTIGYVLAAFPVFSETFVGTEMRAMARHGHRIVPIVLARTNQAGQKADHALAEQAIYLDQINPAGAASILRTPATSALRGIAFSFAQRKLPRRSLIWNALKIAHAARASGCQHLHAHFAGPAAAHAIVAARWIGASMSFVGHGHDIYAEPTDLTAKLVHSDFAVAVCRDMAADFQILAPMTPVAEVTCGVDPTRFTPRPSGQADNGRYLFVGRLVEAKGCADLLDALGRLQAKNMILAVDIVGDGPLRQVLTAQAQALGLTAVRFLGARPAEWLMQEAPAYRALLCPFKEATNGERDTGPVVAKEAMAMALPVIASRFMGLKEMITGETGRLVPPGDSVALATQLAEFECLSPADRTHMGQAGRQRLLDLFTDAHQAEKLSTWVERMP